MSKFVIYQEQLKSELHNEINELGWYGAWEKYPALKTIMQIDLRPFDGIVTEKFKEVFQEHYLAVAECDAEDVDHVFHLGNTNQVNKLEENVRSAAVGDVVYDVRKDEYNVCLPTGWFTFTL